MRESMHFATRFLLAGIVLILGACQPAAATVVPSAPTATAVPTESPGYRIHWTYQTEGAIWGTPSIHNDVAYIGSDDHCLYALDAATGDLKWRFATQGLVRSRPAVADGLVYFASDDGYLYAVEAEGGDQVWRTDIGNLLVDKMRESPGANPAPTGFDYLQSSPVVSDGQVFIGSFDGNVYALDANGGAINWAFATGGKVRATPRVDAGAVYIGSWDGTSYALDARTGELVWAAPLGGQVQTTALAADGLVYTASRKASVVALDAQTGRKRWEYNYGRNQWVESSPQLVGNLIYIGSSGNQMIVGLDSKTGEVLTAYQGQVFFWSTPVITDDMLYIGAEAFTETEEVGGLYAFEVSRDVSFKNRIPIKLKWVLPVADTLMPDGNWAGVSSSPVIDNRLIYFGGLDGKLYVVALEP